MAKLFDQEWLPHTGTTVCSLGREAGRLRVQLWQPGVQQLENALNGAWLAASHGLALRMPHHEAQLPEHLDNEKPWATLAK